MASRNPPSLFCKVIDFDIGEKIEIVDLKGVLNSYNNKTQSLGTDVSLLVWTQTKFGSPNHFWFANQIWFELETKFGLPNQIWFGGKQSVQSTNVASKPAGNNRNNSLVTLRKSCFGSFGLLNQIWFANQFWFHKPNLVWSEPNLVCSGNPKPNLVCQTRSETSALVLTLSDGS